MTCQSYGLLIGYLYLGASVELMTWALSLSTHVLMVLLEPDPRPTEVNRGLWIRLHFAPKFLSAIV